MRALLISLHFIAFLIFEHSHYPGLDESSTARSPLPQEEIEDVKGGSGQVCLRLF